MNEKLLIAETLAHIIVADKQIHCSEMTVLEDFFSKENISKEDQESVYKILGDTDDKKPLSQIIVELKKISQESNDLLLDRAMAIISIDTYIDKSESDIIDALAEALKWDPDQTKKLMNSYHSEYLAKHEEKKATVKNYSGFARFKMKIKALFSKKEQKQELQREAKRLVLMGPKYTEAIKKGSDIALHDSEFIENIITKSSHEAKQLVGKVELVIESKAKGSTKESEELVLSLNQFLEFIKHDVNESIEQSKEVLNAKKRAMHFFTISFLGRTKAGKSTLHYILTGEGNAFIGKGQERTTRYNRVYEWEKLRIIDTPGIGAAEDGGRSDEQIALSVVDESDIICYVVTNDNIQETEFAFLKAIRGKNKPVIILLNIKENITIPPLYNKFIANPHNWYERRDEQNINGHIDRIKQYINEFYDNNYVKIVPVHLLAAKLSRLPEYVADSSKLNSGSHIDDLLDNIRESILKTSTIRRSQTIIDGTTHLYYHTMKATEAHHATFSKGFENIKDKKAKLSEKLSIQKRKAILSAKSNLESLFSEFKNRASDFAEDNYDKSESELESSWKRYTEKELRMQERVNDALKKPVEDISIFLKEYLNDISSDLGAFIKNEFSVSFTASDVFNTKRLISGLGAGLGVLGAILAFTPVGWVGVAIGIIGGAVSFLAGLFKSKEQKRQEAIQKLRENLHSSLDKYKHEIINKIPSIIDEQIDKMDQSVGSILDIIVTGFGDAERISKNLHQTLNEYYTNLDLYYARRIVDFATDDLTEDIAISYKDGIQVQREYGKYMTIKTSKKIPEKVSAELSETLQESISFDRIKE